MKFLMMFINICFMLQKTVTKLILYNRRRVYRKMLKQEKANLAKKAPIEMAEKKGTPVGLFNNLTEAQVRR